MTTMTPTEQDKELRRNICGIATGVLWGKNFNELTPNERSRVNAMAKDLEAYITADRKRMVLEARLNGKWEILSKIPDGTSVLENGKIGSAYKLRIKVNREIAELKAQQEEV